ncbi:MAG: hypothetical protein E6I52_29770, partial [Chloroflexi bacterium]
NLAAGLANPANNTFTTSPNTTTTSTTTTYNASVASLNVSGSQPVSQTYTFSSSTPGQVTLTRSSDGLGQTLTLSDIAAGGTESLNFATLGIVTNVTSAAGITAVALADALIKPVNNTFSTSSTTQSANVTTLDVSGAPAVNDTYTLSNPSSGQIKLTRASDGLTQTLAAPTISAGGSALLNFTTLGIKLTLGSAGGISSSNVAAALAQPANNTFQTQPTTTVTTSTQNGTVTSLDVSSAPSVADTYTFTSSAPGQLTLTRASDGLNQTLTLSNIPAGGSALLNFTALGIKLNVSSSAGIASDALSDALTRARSDSFKTQPLTTVTTTNESGLVSNVDISGVTPAAQTLTFTSSAPGQLTLTRSTDSASQTITAPAIGAGGSALLDFSSTLGVNVTLSSGGSMTAASVVDALTRPATDDITINYSSNTAQVTTLDASGAQPGMTYTFSSPASGQVKLTRSDGVSQTVPVAAIAPGASQRLNFTSLGIWLIARSTCGISASDLATAFATPPNNSIQTVSVPSGPPGTATVTNIDVTSAQAANQTYTFTSVANQLTLTRSSDGLSETITPPAIAAGSGATVSFATLGVKVALRSIGGMSSLNVAEALSQSPNNTFDTTFTSTTTMTTVNTDVVDLMVGAAASDNVELVLGEVSINSLGLTTALDTFNINATSANAQTLIGDIDSAITAVSTRRTIFGVFQNRLEHIVAAQGEARSDTMTADSRIRDADMAAEMVTLTKARLQQAFGEAIMAQANVNARSVLGLLYSAAVNR